MADFVAVVLDILGMFIASANSGITSRDRRLAMLRAPIPGCRVISTTSISVYNAMPSTPCKPVKCLTARQSGFTLIEVMIVVAIIGILTAIALPSYRNYVIRGKLVAGTNALANMRAQMEQYYQDNRTYATVSATIVTPCVAHPVIASSGTPFNVGCSATSDVPTAIAYTLRATGTGTVAGAEYTIDQYNNMTTVHFPTSWGPVPSNNGCWIMRKGDSC